MVSPRPIVIVSPHFDDAALSLGGWISATTESGQPVRVVTAFGNATDDERPAEHWDERAGFATAAEAATARRKEEEAAMRVLGAELVALPFPDSTYLLGERDEAAFLDAIEPHLADAAEVLLPGYPLVHRDHRWLAHLDYEHLGDFTVRFYVEQPYAWWSRTAGHIGIDVAHSPLALRHLRRKMAAIRCYASQVPLLGGWRLFARIVATDVLGPGEGLCFQSRARPADSAHPSEEHSAVPV